MQSKRSSIIEAITNTTAWFVISLWLSIILLPKMELYEYTYISLIFTVASIIRSYVIRRIFNGK